MDVLTFKIQRPTSKLIMNQTEHRSVVAKCCGPWADVLPPRPAPDQSNLLRLATTRFAVAVLLERHFLSVAGLTVWRWLTVVAVVASFASTCQERLRVDAARECLSVCFPKPSTANGVDTDAALLDDFGAKALSGAQEGMARGSGDGAPSTSLGQ